MNLVKRSKKVGISLVLGVSVAVGAMSMCCFADGVDKTLGGFRLDGNGAQYIYFGEIPKNDKYLKKVQGKEIMWKVNNTKDKKEDILRVSIRREKIKNKESDSVINDCFSDKEERIILDPKGSIREEREIREVIDEGKKAIDEIKEFNQGILEKIYNIFHKDSKDRREEGDIGKESKKKRQVRKVEYIDIDIPVANIIYKSGGSSKWCEVGLFKSLKRLDVSKNKLTVVDEDRKAFQVDEDEVVSKAGGSVRINYHNAVLSEEQGKEYISAIIKDTKGDALYYGKFTNVFSADGYVNITLPNDIDEGEYELMVLAEQENGTKKTNYAGFDTLKLEVNA